MEVVKITDFIRDKALQVQYPSGRDSTVSARDLVSSSEGYSEMALIELQAVVLDKTKSRSKSHIKTITVQTLKNIVASTGEVSEAPE